MYFWSAGAQAYRRREKGGGLSWAAASLSWT